MDDPALTIILIIDFTIKYHQSAMRITIFSALSFNKLLALPV